MSTVVFEDARGQSITGLAEAPPALPAEGGSIASPVNTKGGPIQGDPQLLAELRSKVHKQHHRPRRESQPKRRIAEAQARAAGAPPVASAPAASASSTGATSSVTSACLQTSADDGTKTAVAAGRDAELGSSTPPQLWSTQTTRMMPVRTRSPPAPTLRVIAISCRVPAVAAPRSCHQ